MNKNTLKIFEICVLALSGGILMLPFLGREALEDKMLIFPEEKV